MGAFWKWVVKNLANIFSIIGILLTLYVGVFYAPSWLNEVRREKAISAERNIHQSIKELVYSDSICTINEILILIKAKEIKLNQTYPFTPQEIIIQVQESFMHDRFLPLQKRKELINELELLKSHIPETHEYTYKKDSAKLDWLYVLISVLATIIIGGTGIFSIYYKYKSEKEKDEEIESQINISSDFQSVQREAQMYERLLYEVLKEYPGIKNLTQPDALQLFDIKFEYHGKNYFIEVKYSTGRKIGLISFERFINFIRGSQGEFWFVSNTGLTDMATRRAKELKKLRGISRKIRIITAPDAADFKNKLSELLKHPTEFDGNADGINI